MKSHQIFEKQRKEGKEEMGGRGILVKFGTLPRTLHSLIIRMIELIFTLLWIV